MAACTSLALNPNPHPKSLPPSAIPAHLAPGTGRQLHCQPAAVAAPSWGSPQAAQCSCARLGLLQHAARPHPGSSALGVAVAEVPMQRVPAAAACRTGRGMITLWPSSIQHAGFDDRLRMCIPLVTAWRQDAAHQTARAYQRAASAQQVHGSAMQRAVKGFACTFQLQGQQLGCFALPACR